MQEGTLKSAGHTAVTVQVRQLAAVLGMATDTSLGACPVRDVLDRIGDKWSVVVISLLGPGPMRFMELKSSIEIISQRMLTRTLRALERDGLVTRTVHPVVPPRVDYELTALGHSLQTVLSQLAEWAFRHTDDIAGARDDYDRSDRSDYADSSHSSVRAADSARR